MYIDSKQGHLTQETLQSAIQTVAYQLVTTTATLVVWELLSLNPAAWHLSNPFQQFCLDRYIDDKFDILGSYNGLYEGYGWNSWSVSHKRKHKTTKLNDRKQNHLTKRYFSVGLKEKTADACCVACSKLTSIYRSLIARGNRWRLCRP